MDNLISLLRVIDWGLIGRLLLISLLAGLIGLERESKQKPVGFRTNILIGLGAFIFMQTALYYSKVYGTGDPTRVIGQIITGIGFLGAGSIIQADKNVHGLTSAASIWVTAGIGVAVALSDYFLAIIATILILVVLRVMDFFGNAAK